MENKESFSFDISLSVLNHLGRNLYRNFSTVLGEAISNAWDANATNVWIEIDKEGDCFFIKDDGVGMTSDDFQNKFLRIGYSKRKDGSSISPDKKRPYIGRKGIGKLALLSCAQRITVISKTSTSEYVGGIIDNSGLDEAIKHDLTPDNYVLEDWTDDVFGERLKDHTQGTVIKFDGIFGGMRSSFPFLKKTIALYFRFSLIDSSFKIHLNGSEITYESLDDLAAKTEFLWKINSSSDPYVQNLEKIFDAEKNRRKTIPVLPTSIKGFIASVEKPQDLKIMTTEERVGIDLFVNGRLREKDILKHIPTARITESYLYGQIHFDDLDDAGPDRFTSSREGVVADDPTFLKLVEVLKTRIIPMVIDDWDRWRIELRKDGDSENDRIGKKERKSRELFNTVSEDYSLPESCPNRKKVAQWVKDLGDEAQYNFASYAECFISENLLRNFIGDQSIALSTQALAIIAQWKKVESESKGKGNISIDIRKNRSELTYLGMNDMAYLVDKKDPIKEACLARDSNEFKPMRDAIAHTSLLTDPAKSKLTSVYENIKARIITLLSEG